jgi:hypothetical protein
MTSVVTCEIPIMDKLQHSAPEYTGFLKGLFTVDFPKDWAVKLRPLLGLSTRLARLPLRKSPYLPKQRAACSYNNIPNKDRARKNTLHSQDQDGQAQKTKHTQNAAHQMKDGHSTEEDHYSPENKNSQPRRESSQPRRISSQPRSRMSQPRRRFPQHRRRGGS